MQQENGIGWMITIDFNQINFAQTILYLMLVLHGKESGHVVLLPVGQILPTS